MKDNELLIRDLCARFPYGIKCYVYAEGNEEGGITRELGLGGLKIIEDGHSFLRVKPYLRPMSSMTETEKKKLNNILEYQYCSDDSCMCEASDWLNAHHFDYRGLIKKGLAIAVTKENNPYKTDESKTEKESMEVK